MRYRPFGPTEMVVSAISLALVDGLARRDENQWRSLIFSALESGVNTFEIVGQDPAILDGVAEGLGAVERHLVFVGLRLGRTATGADFTPLGLVQTVEAVLARTGLEYLDAVLLDDPSQEVLTPESLAALKSMRETGAARRIGVAGEGPAIDFYISSRHFDVLATPFNLLSGWTVRNRIRDAVDRNMAIIGYDFCPPVIARPPERPSLMPKKLWARQPAFPSEAGVYDFLHGTHNWTAEAICLNFALTQPALATIQVSSDHVSALPDLAEAIERELPPGLAPRIEMARFGGHGIQARA